MKVIVGVRFKKPGKIYFFDPGRLKIEKNTYVIVETSSGEEYGEAVIVNRLIPEDKIVSTLKPVIRIAKRGDIRHNEENKKREKEAFKICLEKIKEHKLKMKLIDVEYKFDNTKILFYFTADGRIDFRELVKDLAAIFKVRIELRQIGVRDEIKRMGGNGVCGRELCCCSFLGNFEAVSIKMAKEQNISLNPSKISGNCGRLMCCLKYEQNVYEEKLERLPKIGAIAETDDGVGEVVGIEVLKEIIKVKFKEDDETFFKKYSMNDIKIIKNVEKEIEENDEETSEEDLNELKKLEELNKIENITEDEI